MTRDYCGAYTYRNGAIERILMASLLRINHILLIAELRGKTYNMCCFSYTITVEGVTTSGDLIHAVKKIAKE